MNWLNKLTSAFRPKPRLKLDSGSLEDDVLEMLTGHGLKDVSKEDGWVFVDGDLPALRANYWVSSQTEDNCTVRVDFELAITKDRHIVECYGDVGSDLRQATGKNLYKFCIGALHVFLSAYWDHHEPDQVDKETWHANGHQWDAYLSSVINTFSEGQRPGIPEDYMARMERAICHLPLSEPEHWISMFFCSLKNEWTIQVRLDNEDHDALTETVREMDWPSADGYYSQRQFILLQKIDNLPSPP